MKSAQIVLHIEPSLKATGEQTAAAEHRSLADLIEKMLAEYCEKQAPTFASSSPSRTDAAPKAAAMAASTIDHMDDRTLPSEERQRRKSRLIRGPKEFRDMRRK
jgi:hypothetical protein